MLFNSIQFMIFFPIVVVLYWIVPRRVRNLWLLLASYYYYLSWGIQYGALIGIITVTTYVCGRLLEQKDMGMRKRIPSLLVAILICLGILGFYKYANFIIENWNILWTVLGHTPVSTLNIILPAGISFYTFQVLGYVIDVYRGKVAAEHNFIHYALYVSFFPNLVSGPIERSDNLLRQINHTQEIRAIDYDRIANGLIMMLYGLFLKMVVADRISILVDYVYDRYLMLHSFELTIGALAYGIQIYCDFASYSTIAIGAAQVMGFSLRENFDTPYMATSIKDFWRRWHISLSSWLRDYVYISLGGNRHGRARKYLNIMITFLISGLWHGADWTFVVWGGLHGLYQIASELLGEVRRLVFKNVNKDCFSFAFGQMVITTCLVDLAWIFFRADSINIACTYIMRMCTSVNPWALFDGTLYNLGLDRTEMNILVAGLVILLLVDLLKYRRHIVFSEFLSSQNLYFRWMVIIAMILMVIIWGEYGATFDAKQFIYIQF